MILNKKINILQYKYGSSSFKFGLLGADFT